MMESVFPRKDLASAPYTRNRTASSLTSPAGPSFSTARRILPPRKFSMTSISSWLLSFSMLLKPLARISL